MFVLTCKIQILSQTGQTITYDYVSDVKINTSIEQFTDTCVVTVPRKLKHEGKSIVDYIARNDEITVKLGYDNELETVFKGYIKSVSTGMPVIIECENKAWELKNKKIEKMHEPSLTLGKFLDTYMPGYEKKFTEVNLGEVRVTETTTLSKVFDYFKSNYPLSFYFREGVFYAGLPTTLLAGNQKTIKFKTGYNIIGDKLNYTRAEDITLQVVAKAILKDNTKLEVKEPENAENADIRTYYMPGAKNEDDLRTFAQEKLQEDKVDKMDGTITAFGLPYVRKGDIVHLLDDKNQERNNKRFLAKAVNYSFGQNGYRQTITLGREYHD